MQDPVVIVLPVQDVWQVQIEGAQELQVFAERYCALECAHRWAQAQRPSLVRVITPDGAVEDEWAYGAFKGMRSIESGYTARSRQ
jgi:Uncharacterized protein conserved in bacteria (DUF2188)